MLGAEVAQALIDNVSPSRECGERQAPYDGLLAEVADEVARLCNDAPKSRDAVYSALQNCNAVVVPSERGEQGAVLSDERILGEFVRRKVHVYSEEGEVRPLGDAVLLAVCALLAAKGE